MSNARTLESKRVVITGGASGIGLATAGQVIEAGGEVIIMSRSRERLDAACTALGASSRGIVLDVTNEADVEHCFKQIGAFDHLLTAAAGTLRGSLTALETKSARALFESKFWGQHHCAKYAAPRLLPGGSITFLGGWISRKPMQGLSTLAAIDGAMESLTRVLALELAPIRVNIIVPGQIDTPLWRARLSKEEQSGYFAKIASQLPVGRAGRAEDIAEAALFLMLNGFTTGAVLDVDGGQS